MSEVVKMSGSSARDEARERLREACKKASRFFLKATPLVVEAVAVGSMLSALVRRNAELAERLGELDGKIFYFEARDIGKGFFIKIDDGDIKVVLHTRRAPDVTMRGDVSVLLDVFSGRVDPDTVFFSRKLEVEGDTATAIHFKNILASVF